MQGNSIWQNVVLLIVGIFLLFWAVKALVGFIKIALTLAIIGVIGYATVKLVAPNLLDSGKK